MEAIFSYICEHVHHAPWIIFGLLLLTGLSIPISEDVLILGGGAIASTCSPEHSFKIYIWILLGCYLSAWEAYWIGRLLGPKLYHIRLFSSIITPQRLDKLRHYYAKFGIFTFIVGRFFPGGFRNALFMSSGLAEMPFYLFILRDSLAALLSSSLLFFIRYKFGENFDHILYYLRRYTEIFLFLIFSIAIGVGIYFWRKHIQNRGK